MRRNSDILKSSKRVVKRPERFVEFLHSLEALSFAQIAKSRHFQISVEQISFRSRFVRINRIFKLASWGEICRRQIVSLSKNLKILAHTKVQSSFFLHIMALKIQTDKKFSYRKGLEFDSYQLHIFYFEFLFFILIFLI